MDSVRGVVEVEVAGEKRTLACDMLAADVLFQQLGPHWLLWLYERFVGKPGKLPDGTKIRKMDPLSPKDLVVALYGMLAADRAASDRQESIDSLTRAISPFAVLELQQALTRAVLTSLGVPGEVKEAGQEAPGAAAVPPGSEPAAMRGTGALS